MKTNFERLFEIYTDQSRKNYEDSLEKHLVIKNRYLSTLEDFIDLKIDFENKEEFNFKYVEELKEQRNTIEEFSHHYVCSIKAYLNMIGSHIDEIEDGTLNDIDPIVDLREFL